MKLFVLNLALCAVLLQVAVAEREVVEVDDEGKKERDFELNPDYTTKYCVNKGNECPGKDIDTRFEVGVRQCSVECNRNFNCFSAFFDKDKICHLRSKRCTKDQLVTAKGGTQLYRLKKDEQCSKTTGENYEAEYKYGRKFCMLKGKRCPKHGLGKGSLYKRPQNLFPQVICLLKCARINICTGVDYIPSDPKRMCDVRSEMCTDAELVEEEGAENYIRLEEGKEECDKGREIAEVPSFC